MLAITVGLTGSELQLVLVVVIALLSGGSVGAVLRRRFRGLDAVEQAVSPAGSPTVSEQVTATLSEVAAIRGEVDAAHAYHAQEHLAFRRELELLRRSVDSLALAVRPEAPPAPPRPVRPLRPAPWPRTPAGGTGQGV